MLPDELGHRCARLSVARQRETTWDKPHSAAHLYRAPSACLVRQRRERHCGGRPVGRAVFERMGSGGRSSSRDPVFLGRPHGSKLSPGIEGVAGTWGDDEDDLGDVTPAHGACRTPADGLARARESTGSRWIKTVGRVCGVDRTATRRRRRRQAPERRRCRSRRQAGR